MSQQPEEPFDAEAFVARMNANTAERRKAMSRKPDSNDTVRACRYMLGVNKPEWEPWLSNIEGLVAVYDEQAARLSTLAQQHQEAVARAEAAEGRADGLQADNERLRRFEQTFMSATQDLADGLAALPDKIPGYMAEALQQQAAALPLVGEAAPEPVKLGRKLPLAGPAQMVGSIQVPEGFGFVARWPTSRVDLAMMAKLYGEDARCCAPGAAGGLPLIIRPCLPAIQEFLPGENAGAAPLVGEAAAPVGPPPGSYGAYRLARQESGSTYLSEKDWRKQAAAQKGGQADG